MIVSQRKQAAIVSRHSHTLPHTLLAVGLASLVLVAAALGAGTPETWLTLGLPLLPG